MLLELGDVDDSVYVGASHCSTTLLGCGKRCFSPDVEEENTEEAGQWAIKFFQMTSKS